MNRTSVIFQSILKYLGKLFPLTYSAQDSVSVKEVYSSVD